MHGNHEVFLSRIQMGLGFYYLILCILNWSAALMAWRSGIRPLFKLGGLTVSNLALWMLLGAWFLILAPIAMMGSPPELPEAVKHLINSLSGPVTLTVGSLAGMAFLFLFRNWWTKPAVAWVLLNLAMFGMGLAVTDANFFEIVGKPDNVPIVGLVFLLGFFTWVATYRAVINDDRRRQGLPPMEKVDDEKVLVWPDLVYTEMICMVAVTALMLVWALALPAPLEEPASSVKTPNPSKAPWYFLGLQEMLVYYDPWYAGVVLPSIVVFGLMAIPFLDFNKGGNGYYTIEERKFSYIVFQIGFFELWIVLIILGTFLRGPNWNFFGPFEYWDAHKVLAQNNVDLSQYFWGGLLERGMPKAPAGSSAGTEILYILWRESPGIILTLGYLLLLPPIMAVTVFRSFYAKMGLVRYMLMANLLLLMASLPLKMVLRWTVNLKYIISIPEYFLNF
ncbi:MAG: hypothetical protein K8U03_02605 [Planctomycetia bacterium]|nr:hypothetical protein [Planctomycetia bacterium]